MVRTLRFSREYELPRAIVWDALVDPVLVGGWLGEATIEAVQGGRYLLDFLGSPDFPAAHGVVDGVLPGEFLQVSTDVHGVIRFVLEDDEGGSRGRSTLLILTVVLELASAFEPRVRANWERSLDRLEQVLRGHPVDWRVELPGSPATAGSGADLA